MTQPVRACIYQIRCTKTNARYIGSSTNPTSRLSVHLSQASRGLHHSSRFQQEFDRYGREAFVLEILEANVEYRYSAEKRYIKEAREAGEVLLNNDGDVGLGGRPSKFEVMSPPPKQRRFTPEEKERRRRERIEASRQLSRTRWLERQAAAKAEAEKREAERRQRLLEQPTDRRPYGIKALSYRHLTRERVIDIFTSDEPSKVLEERWGVTQPTVSNIRNGRSGTRFLVEAGLI